MFHLLNFIFRAREHDTDYPIFAQLSVCGQTKHSLVKRNQTRTQDEAR